MGAPYNSTDNPNPNGKHPGGRPPLFETPEELQAKIDEYFKKCDEGEKRTVIKKGSPIEITQKIPYTVEGLCLALGFADRGSLLDYKENDEFSHIITRAKVRIAGDSVEGGMMGKYEPKITGLHLQANFGYSTMTKAEISGPDGGPIELTNLERASKLAALQKLAEVRKIRENKGD